MSSPDSNDVRKRKMTLKLHSQMPSLLQDSTSLPATAESGSDGGLLLPHPQLSRVFGLTPMPLEFLPVLAGILLVYIATAEGAKKIFYQRVAL